MSDLTFKRLREISEMRAARWSGVAKLPLSFSLMELAGEVGEACNDAKKLARLEAGMLGGVDTTENLRLELADVVICCDLVAQKIGIDLGEAVREKFNKTSEKHGFSERL